MAKNTPRERTIPFGLKDGRMVHVEEVEPGKDCGCVCVECGGTLVASNKLPREVAMYFRHDSGAECAGGYETAIHRAAKEVLLRLRRVSLPGRRERLQVAARDGKEFARVVEIKPRAVAAEEAFEELWQDGMRPDVVYQVGGRTLYLEILVSHAVDLAKQAEIRGRKIAALEIDLSDLSPSDLKDMARFEKRVCESFSSRDWLYFPKFEERLEVARRELEEEKAAYEAELAIREAERRQQEAIENERRRLQAAKEAELAAQKAAEEARIAQEKAATRARRQEEMRRKHASVLACIEGFQDPSMVEELDRRREGTIKYQPQQGQFAPDNAFLFKRTEGFWIFEARHQDWQAFVLDLIFPPEGPRQTKTVKALARAVSERFGIVPWVAKVNRLEIARRFAPDSDDGVVLHTTEAGAIPDPYRAVSHYLEHLASMGMVDKRLHPLPGQATESLSAAIKAWRAREKEKQTKAELVDLAAKLRRGDWGT